MSTTEADLLRMLSEMEGQEEMAIDEPIQMLPPMGATAAPIEGFTPGMSEEEALGLRADIAEEEGPASRLAQAEYHEQHAPGGHEPMMPLRANPYAPASGEGPSRDNPYAPRQPKERSIDELSDFPMERGTSRASLQLPELGSEVGTAAFFNAPGVEELPTWAQLGLTSAILTTTDPNEIAQIFQQEVEFVNPVTGEMESTRLFPHIGLSTAPDGTLVLSNNATEQQAIINRPGISKFDMMQMGTLGVMYTPTGRVAAGVSQGARVAAAEAAKKVGSDTARRLALREARKRSAQAMVVGSAVTEAGIQLGQEQAGGEFNAGDVAMSAAFGVVPDYVFDPLARTATKIPSYLKAKAADVVPENIQQALAYAKESGRRIMTQDVLGERMTPAMQILTKVVERIPITGTGGLRKQMGRERIDMLTELAAKYGIDVETDYGTRVMESFVDRMMKRRFWGANEDLVLKGNRTRAQEMIERAYEKEMEEITHGVLRTAIQENRIDDLVVDGVMRSNRPRILKELFNKLMPEGRQAARQRWLMSGLEEASWTPGSPGIAKPDKFFAWMDRPANKKVVAEWFSPEDQATLNGMREYLRITAAAETTGKGAGMVAAGMAAGGGISWAAGMLNALVGATAATGLTGRFIQGPFIRDRLLKLAHVAGDELKTAAIMRELRPYMVAAENQWKQDNYYFPEVNITPESLKATGEDLLYETEETAKGLLGDIGQIPDKVVGFFKGED